MSVNISYETDESLGLDDYENIIKDVVEAALDEKKCPYETEVNVILLDDEDIRRINNEFREMDNPTDVLSFPTIEFNTAGDFDSVAETLDENEAEFFNPDTGELMLGDMIISVDKVKAQAKEYGHSVKRELAFLVAHSMFHLFGYDHMTETEAREMESEQESVLTKLGITRE